MNLFLDTSVLLAACGSEHGASNYLFRVAGGQSWALIASPYVIEEVHRNLPELPFDAARRWSGLRAELRIVDDVLTIDRPTVLPASKDRPVLFTALAWADILLTLDRADFTRAIGSSFYGLVVCTPGAFLESERAAGRIVDRQA